MNGAPTEPAPRFFDREIRRWEENAVAHPQLDPDHVFSVSTDQRTSFLAELCRLYPEGHWATSEGSYRYGPDIAFQLLLASLAEIANDPGAAAAAKCVRTVRSPRLSPYFRKPSFIVVPSGFLTSAFTFVQNVYALAALGAHRFDPARKTGVWHDEHILSCQFKLCQSDGSTYSQGVFDALQPTLSTMVLMGASDVIKGAAQSAELNLALARMMPSRKFHGSEAILGEHPDVRAMASAMARLLVAFTLCHELGHGLGADVASSLAGHPEHGDADSLAHDEPFADTIGVGFFFRLLDNGSLGLVTGRARSVNDFHCAIAAFHCWNLSLQLSNVMTVGMQGAHSQTALDSLATVSRRWSTAIGLLRKAESAKNEPVDGEGSTEKWFSMWSLPAAEMLRLNLRLRGFDANIEQALDFLNFLDDRNGKLYELLAAPAPQIG